jgi:flagellar hook-associated protein 3 FlgL
MSRVSENSSVGAINYAVGKTKGKVEDLQLKGSTLKRISKPSDDPVGNVELMAIRSQNIDATQYVRNLNFAQTQLAYTENVLEDITDLLTKAKELAVGQASSIYGPEIRAGVSKEIHQLRQQILSLANKRMGNRYLFSGQKILTRPFDQHGQYQGDKTKINVEINKDVYVPINLTGEDVFFSRPKRPYEKSDLELKVDVDLETPSTDRGPASEMSEVTTSIFDELRGLENALLTDNPKIVQALLEKLDDSIDRVIAMRTEVGALTNTIVNTEANIEKSKLLNEAHKSKIEDADVTELFSELQKEQNVLKATYRSSSTLMNTSLMDFLR